MRFAFAFLIAFLMVLFAPINSSPTLNRVRSSFAGRNDASYNLREVNRSMIQPYIYGHPFGGGLGTTGMTGLDINPGHPLAGFQTDNGYLQSALEIGWLGLIIILIQFFIILKTCIRGYFNCTNENAKTIYAACICCILTFYVANLAQPAIGQLNEVLIYYPVISILLRLNYMGLKNKYGIFKLM